MEYGHRICETFVASLNLPTSGWEHKFVGVTSAGLLSAPTDKGTDAIGVLEIGGDAGQACTVTVFGMTKVRGGAALAGGARVTTTASGFAVAVTSGEVALARMVANCTSGYLGSAIVLPGGGSVNEA